MTGKMFPIPPERGGGDRKEKREFQNLVLLSEKRQFRLITSALNKKQEKYPPGENHFNQPYTLVLIPAPGAERNLDTSEKSQAKHILKNESWE